MEYMRRSRRQDMRVVCLCVYVWREKSAAVSAASNKKGTNQNGCELIDTAQRE